MSGYLTNTYTMRKVKDNIAEIIVATLTVAALSSCSFNHKAEAMPPVHKLYDELSIDLSLIHI